VVPDEVEVVGRQGLRSRQAFGRLPVVWELQDVQHLRVFLFEHLLPRVVGGTGELAADSSVVQFVFDAFQDRICVWKWSHLIFRVGWESVGCQNLFGFFSLLWVCLPFDVAVKMISSPFYPAKTVSKNARTHPFQPSLSRLKSSSRFPTALMASSSLLNSGLSRG
jgi:hypothetical protein